MRRLFWCFFLLPTLLCSDEDAQRSLKRIYAHVKIHDAASAIREAKLALETFPQSQDVQRALISSLCMKGEEIEALKAWNTFSESFTEEKTKNLLLENLSWGVLRRADHSSQWHVRLYALIGAALTRDARALPIILDALRGSNASLRAIAVRLSVTMRDGLLQDELLRLLNDEPNWYVRLEVIQAVGTLQMTSAKERLKDIVADSRVTPEEKQVAITALIQMLDSVGEKELQALFSSPHSGHRVLACEIVSYFELKAELGEVLPLLKDSSSQVRIAALNCLGLLGVSTWRGDRVASHAIPLLKETPTEVAITAAWAATLLGDDEGLTHLMRWLEEGHLANRRLAAGAVATLGKKGVSLAYKALKSSDDHYVKATLARGLIGQRKHLKRASETLFTVLTEETKTMWMWDQSRNPLFRSLAPSTLWHTEELANYPYLMDQLIRLDLLSVLSQLRNPKALSAVKQFLQHQRSQVVGAAAYVLLEEGDDEALELVRQLLDERNEKVRFQAAITLALFGRDPKAIHVLQDLYPQLDHAEKLHVLEALAHIGDRSSIPFFIDQLGEPHQTLRVAAASALMQALYN